MDLEARRARRREALLAAGVELLGAAEGPSVSVRAVCSRAGLTERYFYENFTDRDAFVREVYALVADRAQQALVAAVGRARRPSERARRAVHAFTELVLDRPEYGRVLLSAPFGDGALGRIGTRTVPHFVALVEAQLPRETDAATRTLTATAVVGALTSLFTAFLDGDLPVDRARFTEHCVAVVAAAGRGEW
ncbi:TetR/AcrR family transcriptional regulator [Rhodococcoides kroppenstedtii]|uniref:TetR/AcrR family transcriptional regulator n=1 Tax=Rhodococcoides kroppenstedtii TaxID=293050 RepID=UPI001BDE8FDE|nr:TetR family transcriptional regulator [Rhodococcus kroppenstedtii]MBT1193487.1 TetR family transcriptional regulator [Rhodococcus kroppenstedtii]